MMFTLTADQFNRLLASVSGVDSLRVFIWGDILEAVTDYGFISFVGTNSDPDSDGEFLSLPSNLPQAKSGTMVTFSRRELVFLTSVGDLRFDVSVLGDMVVPQSLRNLPKPVSHTPYELPECFVETYKKVGMMCGAMDSAYHESYGVGFVGLASDYLFGTDGVVAAMFEHSLGHLEALGFLYEEHKKAWCKNALEVFSLSGELEAESTYGVDCTRFLISKDVPFMSADSIACLVQDAEDKRFYIRVVQKGVVFYVRVEDVDKGRKLPTLKRIFAESENDNVKCLTLTQVDKDWLQSFVGRKVKTGFVAVNLCEYDGALGVEWQHCVKNKGVQSGLAVVEESGRAMTDIPVESDLDTKLVEALHPEHLIARVDAEYLSRILQFGGVFDVYCGEPDARRLRFDVMDSGTLFLATRDYADYVPTAMGDWEQVDVREPEPEDRVDPVVLSDVASENASKLAFF